MIILTSYSKADKGNATVAMNFSDHRKKIEMFSDSNTYTIYNKKWSHKRNK